MNIDEMKDRIARAEEIQRYTENRCETLEKRITELEATNKKISDECHKLVATLEKKQNENAELKARVDKQDSDILFLKHLTENLRDHLTRAKDMVRMVIYSYNHEERFTFEKDFIKAEQVLKDDEEEK